LQSATTLSMVATASVTAVEGTHPRKTREFRGCVTQPASCVGHLG
jgi:hypothetical protein